MIISTILVLLVSGISGVRSVLSADVITLRHHCSQKGSAVWPFYSLFCSESNIMSTAFLRISLFLLSVIFHYLISTLCFFANAGSFYIMCMISGTVVFLIEYLLMKSFSLRKINLAQRIILKCKVKIKDINE